MKEESLMVIENSESQKLQIVNQIYDRQHFFIDRHETMAEKLLTILMLLTTIIAAIVTFNLNDFRNLILLIPFLVYLICFSTTLLQLINVIQSLSSKAIKQSTTFIDKGNKSWLEESLIYYRGIIKIKEKALSENKVPLIEYDNMITYDHFYKDMIKQIFILAHYSDYKRKRLEAAKRMTIVTILSGLVSISFFVCTSILDK